MGNTVELTPGGSPPRSREGPFVDPMLGRHLLHYRVEERIGQGGMSVVYRGTDERLNRTVAIKLLHPFLAEKAECRARLAREARAVARLEHENILRILDFSGDPATLDERPPEGGDAAVDAGFSSVVSDEGFIVTELVNGGTLKEFAEDHHLHGVPEVGALIVWQLARALQHAHDQGVVHRDLKPENVMVREDGVLKLMDFGIAQVVDSKSLTVTGTLLGSPAHMAPECIEGLHADARSDIFSLGTVLYWVSCGALPFEALTPHALLKAIVDGRFSPPQQKQPRISDPLSKIIRRAMANKPDDRYQTAGQFADALAEGLRLSGVDASAKNVRELLADPEQTFVELSETVRVASLERASALLDDGRATKALSTLGRVLAEHPQDEQALRLLERAQSLGDDADDEDDGEHANEELFGQADEREADRSPPPIAHDDRPPTAVTSELPAGMLTAPVAVAAPIAFMKRVGLVLAAAALLATVVVVSNRVSQPRPPSGNEVEVASATDTTEYGMSLDPSVGVAGVDAKLIGKNGKSPPTATRRGGQLATDRGGRVRRPRPPATTTVPAGTQRLVKAPDLLLGRRRQATLNAGKVNLGTGSPGHDASEVPSIDGPIVRKVLVVVNSFGEVTIDGAETFSVNPRKITELKLAVGPHELSFSGNAVATEKRTVNILAEGPPTKVKIQFRPLPAALVVICDEPEAYVTVRPMVKGGKEAIVGQAKHSLKRPFTVRFPADPAGRLVGKLTFEVTAKHEKRIVTRQVDLRAGQSKRIRLNLFRAQP